MDVQFPKKITVSVIPLRRVVDIHTSADGRIILQGADGKLLNILSQYLNFEYNVITPPDSSWGRQSEDGNWTGMIGQVYRGEADFSMTWTTITKEREKAVDFSEPYALNEITYVTTLPGNLPKAYAFFYPFDIATWCSIAILILATPLIFQLLTRHGPSYWDRLLYLYGTIMHQALTKEHFYHRSLLGIWWMAAFILSASYTGVLSSFLSIPLRMKPIENFYELAIAASKGQYRCLDVKGTVAIPGLLDSGVEHLILLARTTIKNEWFIPFAESQTESYFDGRTAHLGSRLFLYFRFGKAPFTRMFISEDTAFTSGISLAMRKDFCCKEAINSLITRVKYAGIYEKILRDEMFQSWLEHLEFIPKSENDIPISLRDILGPLIILTAGYVIAMISFLLECVVAKMK